MKIEKERMTVEDTCDKLIETKDGITCGCGNPSLNMTCHIDGKDFYSYSYKCTNCGNQISMQCKRSKEDAMYWD